MTRQVLIASAAAVAMALAWLAWDGWLYLQRGYSLTVSIAGPPSPESIAGPPPSEHKVEFPAWRADVHLLLWFGAIAAIGAYLTERPWAATAAWLASAADSFVGLYDVLRYGTLGSPSSIWTVLLLLLFALLATFAPLSQSAKA